MSFDPPSEAQFLEAFSVVPSQRPNGDDMVYCYTLDDSLGGRVELSFDVIARSIQTSLSLNGRTASVVTMEGATSMRIIGRAVEAAFEFAGARSELRVATEPALSVTWSTLLC